MGLEQPAKEPKTWRSSQQHDYSTLYLQVLKPIDNGNNGLFCTGATAMTIKLGGTIRTLRANIIYDLH